MNLSSKKTTLGNVNLKIYQQSKLKQTNMETLYNQENDLDYSTQYQVSSKYNHNGNNDLDTIYINELSTITNEIQNNFTNEEDYLIYCKYLEGKTLKEIVNSNYKANYLTYDNDHNQIQKIMKENNIEDNSFDVIKRIDEALTKFNESSDLKNFSKLSNNMMNAEFVEICHTDSGYDASVLKDINGNYMIVNSCTNASSLKDILAISYPICRYLTGSDDFIQIIFDYLVNNADLTNVSEEYFSISESFDNNKNLYEEQINDNLKLVEKYCDKAKNDNTKVDLYAYSLDGGTQETTYASLKDSNSDKLQYIQSISVYNPFTLYAQEYKDNYIDLLANDDKLCIYSAEQDYVSTFNDSVGDLLNKTVFLKADDIESNSVNGISDVGGLIIGSNSNHGFAPLNKSAFDENGNINETGEFISINASIANATGSQSKTSKFSKAYNNIKDSIGSTLKEASENSKMQKTFDYISNSESIKSSLDNPAIKEIINDSSNFFENTVNSVGTELKEEVEKLKEKSKYNPNYQAIFNDIFNSKSIKNSIEDENLKILLDDLIKYMGRHFGKIEYDEIADIISKNLSNIILDEVYKVNEFGGKHFDKNAMYDAIFEELTSKDGKELVLDLFSCYLNNDTEACNKQIDILVEDLIDEFDNNLKFWQIVNKWFIEDKLEAKLKTRLKKILNK